MVSNNIDALAEEEMKLEALVERLDKTCTRYKMDINAEKNKLLRNSSNSSHREIKEKGQKLSNARNFKYLRAFVSGES